MKTTKPKPKPSAVKKSKVKTTPKSESFLLDFDNTKSIEENAQIIFDALTRNGK